MKPYASINRIALDMDDVLVDCSVHALQHMGLADYTIDQYPDYVGRDIYAAYANVTGLVLSPALWWEHFKREWWAGLPPMDHAHDLINKSAELVGPENVFILTSPTKCGDCLAGKLDWIHEHTPPWLHRQYVMTPRKWLCATPNTLLIDDAEENIGPFREHGGRCIAFPRPWNYARGRTLDAYYYVSQWLDWYDRRGDFS